MSTKLFKKSSRNGLSMNDDKTKNKDLLKKDAKDVETKFQKEAEKKKTTIDWEEEKDVLKKFIHQEYPLITNTKLNKIIDERNEKYIDFTKYKSFFLKFQARNLVENINESRDSGAIFWARVGAGASLELGVWSSFWGPG